MEADFNLASGPNRVNEKTIAEKVGERIEKADAEFTRDSNRVCNWWYPTILIISNI